MSDIAVACVSDNYFGNDLAEPDVTFENRIINGGALGDLY